MPRPERKHLLVAFTGGVLLLLLYAASDVIIRNMRWEDFSPKHVGCNAMLQSGRSPYSEATNEAILALNPPEDNPMLVPRFFYPAHICYVMTPYWPLPREVAARAFVMTNLLILGSVVLGAAAWHGRQMRPLTLLLQFVVMLFGFRYAMMTVILGQFTAFTTFGALLAIWGVWQRRDWAVALGLAGMTIRPDSTLVMLLLSLFLLYRRQWRTLTVTGGLLLAIWLASHASIGTWETAFINETINYSGENSPYILWLPGFLGVWGILLYAGAIGLGLYQLWRMRSAPLAAGFAEVGILGLLLSMIAVPQTNPYVLVYALPAAFWLLHKHWESLLAWSLWFIGLGVVSWLIFILWPSAAGVEQMLYPLSLLLLMIREPLPSSSAPKPDVTHVANETYI